MGLLGKIMKFKNDPSAEISKTFALADCEPEDCDGCSSKFPSSVKIDVDLPLWNNTSTWSLQLLAATGRTDWLHDVAEEKDSLCHALSPKLGNLEKLAGGAVKAQASSLSLPHEHYEVDNVQKAPSSVLMLPYFIEIQQTTQETVTSDVSKVIELFTSEKRGQLGSPYTLPSSSLAVPSQNLGYILLCSHRTRDKRCGVTAPIMKKEFERVLRDHDLYRDASDDRPGGVNVHFISHVGGHKFSANVIIYLRTGEVIWMARTRPEHCQKIVETTMLQKKVFPHLLRQAFRVDSVDW